MNPENQVTFLNSQHLSGHFTKISEFPVSIIALNVYKCCKFFQFTSKSMTLLERQAGVAPNVDASMGSNKIKSTCNNFTLFWGSFYHLGNISFSIQVYSPFCFNWPAVAAFIDECLELLGILLSHLEDVCFFVSSLEVQGPLSSRQMYLR